MIITYLRFFAYTLVCVLMVALFVAIRQFFEGDSFITGFLTVFIPFFFFCIVFSLFGAVYSRPSIVTYEGSDICEKLNAVIARIDHAKNYSIEQIQDGYIIKGEKLHKWLFGNTTIVIRDDRMVVSGANCVIQRLFGSSASMK